VQQPTLSDDDGLGVACVAVELRAVGGSVLLSAVVVDADDVERCPVDLLDRDRGVGDRAMEMLPCGRARFGEEVVQRFVVGPKHFQAQHRGRKPQRISDALQHIFARQDALHEQGEF
jgi:hypothetical protein